MKKKPASLQLRPISCGKSHHQNLLGLGMIFLIWYSFLARFGMWWNMMDYGTACYWPSSICVWWTESKSQSYKVLQDRMYNHNFLPCSSHGKCSTSPHTDLRWLCGRFQEWFRWVQTVHTNRKSKKMPRAPCGGWIKSGTSTSRFIGSLLWVIILPK